MKLISFLCLSRILKILFSLLSPTAFALGTVNFADYERAHVGIRWTNMWKVSVTFAYIELLNFCTLGGNIVSVLLYCNRYRSLLV